MAIKLDKEIERKIGPEKKKMPRKKKKLEQKRQEKKKPGNKIMLEKKIVQGKKKKKKRGGFNFFGENLREAIGAIVVMIGIVFLIIGFILWGVSEIIGENFIWSEIVGAYCGASICLCFGLVFIGLIIGIRNWLGKLGFLFFAGVMLSVSYDFIETASLLYQDKEAYENKEFESLVATPTGEEYDDPDYGPVYLMELEFKNLTIDVYNLHISRNYYKENLSGKPLEIEYLPNSRFAVSVNAVGAGNNE